VEHVNGKYVILKKLITTKKHGMRVTKPCKVQ
jgi:hypothetical protein